MHVDLEKIFRSKKSIKIVYILLCLNMRSTKKKIEKCIIFWYIISSIPKPAKILNEKLDFT